MPTTTQPRWNREYEQDIHDYYGISPYWTGPLPR